MLKEKTEKFKLHSHYWLKIQELLLKFNDECINKRNANFIKKQTIHLLETAEQTIQEWDDDTYLGLNELKSIALQADMDAMIDKVDETARAECDHF